MDNISIIIRNKNEERWIGHAIQSSLDRDWETIACAASQTDLSGSG